MGESLEPLRQMAPTAPGPKRRVEEKRNSLTLMTISMGHGSPALTARGANRQLAAAETSDGKKPRMRAALLDARVVEAAVPPVLVTVTLTL
jgi:hypothetical protein